MNSNFGSSTLDKTQSSSIAGYRKILHERKSQPMWQTSLLPYFKQSQQPPSLQQPHPDQSAAIHNEAKPSNSKSESEWSRSVLSDSLRPHGLQPTMLLHPWDFPGKSTGVDCHFLLQRIFPTQGSNLGFLHCRQTLYHLSHKGSPTAKKVTMCWRLRWWLVLFSKKYF